MKVSLLNMGHTKKRNVRESIISILSREFPLNIKHIYNRIKKEYSLGCTYQAIFKVLKDMEEDNILEKKDKEYRLNMAWIKDLKSELDVIQQNYLGGTQESDDITKKNVIEFVAKVAPAVKDYIGEDKAIVIPVGGGGRIFGIPLWKYLIREGLNVEYLEIGYWAGELPDPIENFKGKDGKPLLKKDQLEDRKVVIVDGHIFSGKTYRTVMDKFNKIKKKFRIKEIKYATDYDSKGLADFSRFTD